MRTHWVLLAAWPNKARLAAYTITKTSEQQKRIIAASTLSLCNLLIDTVESAKLYRCYKSSWDYHEVTRNNVTAVRHGGSAKVIALTLWDAARGRSLEEDVIKCIDGKLYDEGRVTLLLAGLQLSMLTQENSCHALTSDTELSMERKGPKESNARKAAARAELNLTFKKRSASQGRESKAAESDESLAQADR